MTLWRRAPREVYRVYGQNEYIGEDGVPAGYSAEAERACASGPPSVAPEDEAPRESRAGRLVGVGLLAGVAVGVVGIVVAGAHHPHGAPRSVAGSNPSARVVSRPRALATGPGATAPARRHPAPARWRARAALGPSAAPSSAPPGANGGRSTPRAPFQSQASAGGPAVEEFGFER